MVISRQSIFFLLMVTQLVLVVIVFRSYFELPQEYMLNNTYDGMKNYYTLYSYVIQDPSLGFARYGFMNYPFGDYTFYTDNTPIVAMVLRWWHLHVFDIELYLLPLFNYFIFANIILAAILTWLIGRELEIHPWLVYFMSILIAWTNPMVFRVLGHFNLTLSSLVLLCILFMIRVYKATKANQVGQVVRYSVYLGLVIVAASFIHFYYFGILGVFVGLFFGFLAIRYLRNPKVRRLMPIPFVALLFAVGAVMGILTVFDGYYELRPEGADGYDWGPWRSELKDVLQSYPFSILPGLWNEPMPISERYGFPGHLFYYVLMGWIASLFFRKKVGKPGQQSFLPYLVLSGVICLLVAQGRGIDVFGWFRMDNIANPFFYIEKFYPRITHFRVIARFVWPFFFVVNIWAFAQLNSWLHLRRHRWLAYVILVPAISLGVINIISSAMYLSKQKHDNIFSQKVLQELPEINYSTYQAILPIPYFNVGNESKPFIMDDDHELRKLIFQLSLKSKLPQMSCLMSRTPVDFSKKLYSIFRDSVPDQLILDKMNEKPVLVVYSKHAKGHSLSDYTQKVLDNGPKIIESKNMTLIHTQDGIDYYEWQAKTPIQY